MALSLRTIMFSDGERYPLLVDESGIPDWNSTIFVTSQIRNASKAPNTQKAVLFAIRSLYSWAETQEINLKSRFSQKIFLKEVEIESLYAFSRALTAKDVDIEKSRTIRYVTPERRQESARAELVPSVGQVTNQTHYIRLTYIANFLEWLAIRTIEQASRPVDRETRRQIDTMVKKLRSLRPRVRVASRLSARRGLAETDQRQLLNLVQPGGRRILLGVPCSGATKSLRLYC